MEQEHDDYAEPHWPSFWVLEFAAVLLIAIAMAVAVYLYLSNQPSPSSSPAQQPIIGVDN